MLDIHKIKIIFLASCILLIGCGPTTAKSPSELSIINGTLPSATGLIQRSTVALVDRNAQTFCTGTLIAARYVLSAAHCLQNFNDSLFIGFGRNADEFTLIAASRFTINSNYTGSFRKSVPADIAIIELSQVAPAGHKPVAIYKGELRTNDQLYLAGFGQTERASTGQLLYTTVRVSSQTASEITVFENRTGACYGDSGGPAFVLINNSLQVVGATSRGVAGCQGSSIYTKAPYFISWLRSWTGEAL